MTGRNRGTERASLRADVVRCDNNPGTGGVTVEYEYEYEYEYDPNP